MYIYTMKKSTIQRQKLIADFIDSGNISSQKSTQRTLKKRSNINYTSDTIERSK